MTESFSALLGLGTGALTAAFLVFLRVGAAVMLLPAFGETMVPVRVKLVVAVALTVIIAPAVLADIRPSVGEDAVFLGQGLTEVAAGLALGLSLRLVVMALQIAGTIAAQATSLSQLLGGAAVDPQPALGVVLLLAALALASEAHLHVYVAAMFIGSYELIGPNTPLASDGAARWLAAAVAHAFRFAFILSLPFVTASLVYNLALGAINRAMPQLMVAFVGAPAITFGALLILALSAPLILGLWLEILGTRLTDPFRVE